tara:strand:+ start:3805 stop:3996 length:192 start_codon:yes stop_codon:yes gene_type:complete
MIEEVSHHTRIRDWAGEHSFLPETNGRSPILSGFVLSGNHFARSDILSKPLSLISDPGRSKRV